MNSSWLQVLTTLTPDIDTLLGVTALPFLYLLLFRSYWHKPQLLRVFHVLFRILVFGIGALILLKLTTVTKTFSVSLAKMYLVHLLPIGLALILSSWFQPSSNAHAKTSKRERKRQKASIKQHVEQVGWDSIIIDEQLKEELRSICSLLSNPKAARDYGIHVPKGILLSGPPGTGKTTIAKAIAHEAKLAFFTLPLDAIFSKWVGESEKNLSSLFQAAASNAPSVLFIDEVDAIGRQRSGGEHWAENLLNHLLQLIDGVSTQDGIYVIAATNRPELVDSALKRAGRLTKEVHIPLPNLHARKALFHLYLSRLKLAENVSIDALCKITEGKSPADIKEICNQAGLNAFKRESSSKKKSYIVHAQDLKQALLAFASS